MTKHDYIESKINKICELLDELQNNQIEQFLSIQRSQNVIIKKINKLQEYNEIDDMNNALIDKRLLRIEQKL